MDDGDGYRKPPRAKGRRTFTVKVNRPSGGPAGSRFFAIGRLRKVHEARQDQRNHLINKRLSLHREL